MPPNRMQSHEPPPRYRREVEMENGCCGQWRKCVRRCVPGRTTVKAILCRGSDIRPMLHVAFLINSMILTICFVVFDLEWKREAFNAKSNCAWQSELLELFINGVALYFLILTLVSSSTSIMCITRKAGAYKNAFYLLTLYSSATFVLSIILSISYFLGSRVIADHCISSVEIKLLEVRMCLVAIAGIVTNGIYMAVGMVQGRREISENVARRHNVTMAYDNQVFHLSPREFSTIAPPPPYARNFVPFREVHVTTPTTPPSTSEVTRGASEATAEATERPPISA